MTKSTFETDGYRDGYAGNPQSLPDIPVYAAEYRRGYEAGKAWRTIDRGTRWPKRWRVAQKTR
jgi:hypothetical protein